MTIADEEAGGKSLWGRIPADMLVLLVLVLASTLAFGLGILVGKDLGNGREGDDAGFWIEQLPAGVVERKGGGPAAALEAGRAVVPLESAPEPAIPEVRTYVASKNGTKYYLPTCGTAKRIKEENRVWFATKAEAEASGYAPAANCPGL